MDNPSISLLFQLTAMAAVAALFGQLMRLVRQPAIFGELLGGILLGPTLLNLFPSIGDAVTARENVVKAALLFFLFMAGTEVHVSHIKKQGRRIFITSLAGILLPFFSGFALVWFYPPIAEGQAGGNSSLFAAFLGTALSISALPVIVRILMDYKLLKTPLGSVIVSAATIDDLIGWTLFAFILNSFVPGAHVHHPVWTCGVFFIGAVFAPKDGHQNKFHKKVHQMALFVAAPIYFVSIGLKTNFAVNFDLSLTFLILGIACTGKIVGAGLGAWISGFSPREALGIGFGMNARGAMEIILASIALEYGLINERLFVALVITALVTSLISGPAMKALTLKFPKS